MSNGLYLYLEAFDLKLYCSVFQIRFPVPDPDTIRDLLALDPEEDPHLEGTYLLEPEEFAAIDAHFDLRFQPERLGLEAIELRLCGHHRLMDIPYLVHTSYELPLMLEGRKKLARFMEEYSEDGSFLDPLEACFDHFVDEGLLYKEVFLEPFAAPVRGYIGHRSVYYTTLGEEWRIQSSRLLWRASRLAGGWNEYFERMEGMLFGYEDWQMDWWINHLRQRGKVAAADRREME